ncbi:MAG: HAD family hydrolase [Hyphomicrobiales bacterium]
MMNAEEIKQELGIILENRSAKIWASRYPKKQIKHVFFDFDGVILKEYGIHEQAYAWIIKSLIEENFDIKIDPDEALICEAREIRKVIKGKSPDEKLSFLISYYSKGQKAFTTVEKLNKKWMEYLRSNVKKAYGGDASLYLLDGARDLVTNCAEHSKIYGLTANYQDQAEWLMKFVGLNSYFKKIYGYPIKGNKELSKAKILSGVIQKYKLDPEEICFIGDGKPDIISGNKNGVYSVGVANTVENGVVLLGENPDALISSPMAFVDLLNVIF